MRRTHGSVYVPGSIRETTLCSYTGAPRRMEGEIDGVPQIELLPRPTIHRRTFRRDVDETKIYLVTGRNRGILNEEFLDLAFFTDAGKFVCLFLVYFTSKGDFALIPRTFYHRRRHICGKFSYAANIAQIK